jgi:hypothetical protein
MKGKQFIYLFLALLFPGCIFVFLKFFGKNEFAVAPLYQTVAPVASAECPGIKMPYLVPDSVLNAIEIENDSLVLVVFGDLTAEGKSQLNRVDDAFSDAPLHEFQVLNDHVRYPTWHSCIFFLREPFNLVLVDNHRQIRGEYNINDREDVDRLLTEIAIILRKF